MASLHLNVIVLACEHDGSPVSGVLLGGGEHEVEVMVDVNPVPDGA